MQPTTIINADEVGGPIEVYTFSPDLSPQVKAVFEHHRKEIVDRVNSVDYDEDADNAASIQLNILESGEYLKEACRILKLDPMAVIGLDAHISDWSFNPGWCINLYAVSPATEGFIRGMFANSPLSSAVEIEVNLFEEDEEVDAHTSISVGFSFDFAGVISLEEQYSNLLRDILEYRSFY